MRQRVVALQRRRNGRHHQAQADPDEAVQHEKVPQLALSCGKTPEAGSSSQSTESRDPATSRRRAVHTTYSLTAVSFIFRYLCNVYIYIIYAQTPYCTMYTYIHNYNRNYMRTCACVGTRPNFCKSLNPSGSRHSHRSKAARKPQSSRKISGGHEMTAEKDESTVLALAWTDNS